MLLIKSFDINYLILYIAVQNKRLIMRTINFTEFRSNASLLLSAVEKGEIVIVMRHGKPIAKILPADMNDENIQSWKKTALRLVTKGKKLSAAIIDERK